MRDTVSSRIKEAIKSSGMSMKEAAEVCGIPYRTVQDYVSGKADPGAANLARIATGLRVSGEWLLTGEGRMERGAEARGGTYDPGTMRAVIEAVEELVRLEGLELRPAKKAELIVILYEDSLEEGVELEPEEMKARTLRLLRLAT